MEFYTRQVGFQPPSLPRFAQTRQNNSEFLFQKVNFLCPEEDSMKILIEEKILTVLQFSFGPVQTHVFWSLDDNLSEN